MIQLSKRLTVLCTAALIACGEQSRPAENAAANPAASTFQATDDFYQAQQAKAFEIPAAVGVLSNDEGAQLSASLKAQASYGVVTLNEDGSFDYAPSGKTLKDKFEYLAISGEQSAVASVTLTLLPPDELGTPENPAPVATADSYSLNEGSSLNIPAEQGLLANDKDEQPLALELLTQPEHGELSVQPDGSFSYRHNHSETTQDSFSYRVSDGAASASATVSLLVNPIDDAPVVERLELAQTHVMKPAGTTWAGEKLSHRELHLVGNRAALVLVDISAANARVVDAVIEAHVDGEKLGEVALNAPERLPTTEVNGPAYSDSAYSVMLDKAWVKPGLELIIRANEGQRSEPNAVTVGAATSFKMYTLPFYLFGLDESDFALNEVTQPNQATRDEYFAKHPVAELEFLNHPARKVEWPYIIVGPRQGRVAQKVTYKEQQGDGYAVMSATLGILHAVRSANGEAELDNQFYAPLLMANQAGNYSSPGGGLGGGGVSTGDHAYTGIFVHEAGHAFGMPHANDGYNSGSYPYVGGSVKGSTWGFDQVRQHFLATFVPANAYYYAGCHSYSIQFDDEGRCLKQDPMQGGAGYQADGDAFTMFSDFNASVVQGYLESKVVRDERFTSGYKRWDKDTKTYVEHTTETVEKGLYGLNQNLPVERDVPVHTIIMTLSKGLKDGVADADLTQIYPPLSYRGNLLKTIDPTSATDLADIKPNEGTYPWFCFASGCDYTLRVTYADDSVEHVALQGGFRIWAWSPGGKTFKTDRTDPTSGNSFKRWSVNVDGGKALKKLELLDTPKYYDGLPENPTVLASRTFD